MTPLINIFDWRIDLDTLATQTNLDVDVLNLIL